MVLELFTQQVGLLALYPVQRGDTLMHCTCCCGAWLVLEWNWDELGLTWSDGLRLLHVHLQPAARLWVVIHTARQALREYLQAVQPVLYLLLGDVQVPYMGVHGVSWPCADLLRWLLVGPSFECVCA